MSRPPLNPDKTIAGIALDPQTLERIIPESKRPDGSVRKQLKIRPGFTPQEDIKRFRSTKQAQMDATALPKGHIIGWAPPPSSSSTKSGSTSAAALSKSAKKNAKRKEKREKEKDEGSSTSTPVPENWDDDEDDNRGESDTKKVTNGTAKKGEDKVEGARGKVDSVTVDDSTTISEDTAAADGLASKLENLQVK